MKNIFKFLSIIILLSSSVLYSKDFKNSIDKKSGLIINKGIETVKTNCTFCHSAKSIILQRATRKGWKEMITWMQKTQGLWAFDKMTETIILDYLSTNYAPSDESSRRKNLQDFELPKNPYKPQ